MGGTLVVTTLNDLRAHFARLSGTHRVALWRFVGGQGTRLASREYPTHTLAETWFLQMQHETDDAAHFSVATMFGPLIFDWIVVMAPRVRPARLAPATEPAAVEKPRDHVSEPPLPLSFPNGIVLAGYLIGVELGRRARAKGTKT
jgi:hypothetical protein